MHFFFFCWIIIACTLSSYTICYLVSPYLFHHVPTYPFTTNFHFQSMAAAVLSLSAIVERLGSLISSQFTLTVTVRAFTVDMIKIMSFYNIRDLFYYFITSFYNISFIRCFIIQPTATTTATTTTTTSSTTQNTIQNKPTTAVNLCHYWKILRFWMCFLHYFGLEAERDLWLINTQPQFKW